MDFDNNVRLFVTCKDPLTHIVKLLTYEDVLQQLDASEGIPAMIVCKTKYKFFTKYEYIVTQEQFEGIWDNYALGVIDDLCFFKTTIDTIQTLEFDN